MAKERAKLSAHILSLLRLLHADRYAVAVFGRAPSKGDPLSVSIGAPDGRQACCVCHQIDGSHAPSSSNLRSLCCASCLLA